jgi:hypothetical protein
VVSSNISTSSPGSGPFDSYTPSSGDHLLLTNQSTGSQNGPWIWNGISSAMTRPTDYATGASVKGRSIQINAGTSNGGSLWVMTTTSAITVDTTPTTWAMAKASAPTGTYEPIVRKTIDITQAGVTGNGRVSWNGTAYDGAMTVDQYTVHSSSAAFTSADVGKDILIQGAGSGGAHLVTTISSVTAGVATVAAECLTSVADACVVFGTDDTTAFQDAINLLEDGIDVDIVVPDAIYIINGELQSGIGQLMVPFVGQTLRFICGPLAEFDYVGSPWTGAILMSLYIGTPATPTNRPAVIHCGVPGGDSVVNVVSDGLAVRCPSNPIIGGMNFWNAWTVVVPQVRIDTPDGLYSIAEPTHPTAIAISLPAIVGGCLGRVGVGQSTGFYAALCHGEGTVVENFAAWGCYVGRTMYGSYHANREGYCAVWHCKYGFAYVDPTNGVEAFPTSTPPATGFFLHVDTYDVEYANGDLSWTDNGPIFDIYDPDNALFLTIDNVNMVTGGVGVETDITLRNLGGKYVIAKYHGVTLPLQSAPAATPPVLLNSWSANANYAPFGVWVDGEGWLCLSGTLGGASSGTSEMFALPISATYLQDPVVPAGIRSISAVQQDIVNSPYPIATCMVQFTTDGKVTVYGFLGGDYVVYLDGLRCPISLPVLFPTESRLTAVGSLATNEGSITTLDVNPTAAGNVLILSIENNLGSAEAASAVSGGGVPATGPGSWTPLAQNYTARPIGAELWMGTVETSGPSTVSVTSAGWGVANGLACQEFSIGVPATWTQDGSGGRGDDGGSGAASGNFPLLTPSGSGELYVGNLFADGGGGAGSSEGFTYDDWFEGSYALFVYNPSASSPTAQDPNWTQTTGPWVAVSALIVGTPA